MFLSVIILLQNSLPCTENFYRYQRNFEKYISSEEGAEARGDQPVVSDVKITTLASPTRMSNSPIASLAKQHGINFNPNSQKNMLQFAANKQSTTETPAASEAEGNGEVNLANFKTAKGVQAGKKALREEMNILVQEGKD